MEKDTLLDSRALTLHLKEFGYKEKALKSLLRCGERTGEIIVKRCGCAPKLKNVVHHCNLRTCKRCFIRRRNRIVRQNLPILNNFIPTYQKRYRFLTISPKNYKNLEYGLKDIRISMNKFVRRKYIRKNALGIMYMIEVKGGFGNWNIHIHAIVYGYWLDNRIRGKCSKCNNDIMKYNRFRDTFYCSNKLCRSEKVTVIKKSIVQSEFEKASRRECITNIQEMNSGKGILQYVTKYITAEKEDFKSVREIAYYIALTYRKRTFGMKGLFIRKKIKTINGIEYSYNIVKEPIVCSKCGLLIEFVYDREYHNKAREDGEKRRKKPPDLFSYSNN